MFNELTLPEQQVIQLKYLGETYPQIEEKTGVALETIQNWFRTGGKLAEEYAQYAEDRTRIREKELSASLAETEANILTVTTNIMRLVGKKLNKEKAEDEMSVSDFMLAWKIQRIIQGLPTDVKTQNFTGFKQDDLDKQAKQFAALLESGKEDDTDDKEMDEKTIAETLNL